MFDPWTATFEEAFAEMDKWRASGADTCRSPIRQISVAHKVLFLKQAIDGGDGFAVLVAISHCVTSGLVAPEWLADAFNRRYASVVGFGVGSWDDPPAFGRPYPKGTNLASLRKAAKGSRAVWQAINEELVRFPETPIDKGLFEKIGKPLGFGATLTEEYYYLQKRIMNREWGHINRLGEIVPIGNTANIRKVAGLHKKKR